MTILCIIIQLYQLSFFGKETEMKNLLIVTLFLAFGISTALAGRVKELSGTVENNVFKDKKYNFSLTLNDDWKYTLQKN